MIIKPQKDITEFNPPQIFTDESDFNSLMTDKEWEFQLSQLGMLLVTAREQNQSFQSLSTTVQILADIAIVDRSKLMEVNLDIDLMQRLEASLARLQPSQLVPTAGQLKIAYSVTSGRSIQLPPSFITVGKKSLEQLYDGASSVESLSAFGRAAYLHMLFPTENIPALLTEEFWNSASELISAILTDRQFSGVSQLASQDILFHLAFIRILDQSRYANITAEINLDIAKEVDLIRTISPRPYELLHVIAVLKLLSVPNLSVGNDGLTWTMPTLTNGPELPHTLDF